ncbi:hypothetical protein ACTXT7_012366 [Hymenolepis weldensis]
MNWPRAREYSIVNALQTHSEHLNVYVETLQTIVKPPWIDSVANGGRPYTFQQDLAPSHKALKIQDWMDDQEFSSSYHAHQTLILWIITYGVGVVKKEVNKFPHNTKSSLMEATARAMEGINKDHLIKSLQSLLDSN